MSPHYFHHMFLCYTDKVFDDGSHVVLEGDNIRFEGVCVCVGGGGGGGGGGWWKCIHKNDWSCGL